MTDEIRTTPDDARAFWKKVKDIRICMMTTEDTDGSLRSRPMATQTQGDFDGRLWFLTNARSPKVAEIAGDHQVNLSYADPDGHAYVSVSGTARVLTDKAAVQAHWSEPARLWFPDGPDSDDIAVLEVDVHKAETWDGSASAMTLLYGYARARLTGKPYNPGESQHLTF